MCSMDKKVWLTDLQEADGPHSGGELQVGPGGAGRDVVRGEGADHEARGLSVYAAKACFKGLAMIM